MSAVNEKSKREFEDAFHSNFHDFHNWNSSNVADFLRENGITEEMVEKFTNERILGGHLTIELMAAMFSWFTKFLVMFSFRFYKLRYPFVKLIFIFSTLQSFNPHQMFLTTSSNSYYNLFQYDRRFYLDIASVLFVHGTSSFPRSSITRPLSICLLHVKLNFYFLFPLRCFVLLFLSSLLLVLSGDVETNPGPRCHVCNDSIVSGLRDSIECSMCESHLHKKCTFLADDDFKTFSRPDVSWICNGCKPHIKSSSLLRTLSDRLEHFTAKLSDLDCKFQMNQDSIASLVLRLEQCEFKLGELSDSQAQIAREPGRDVFVSSVAEVVQGQLKVSFDERDRERNLVLFNALDNSSDPNHDKSLISDFYNSLSLGYLAGLTVFKRIGSFTPNSNRPLLITLPSISIKWTVFSRRYLLRESDNKDIQSISLVPDKSLRQRIAAKRLRSELIARRASGENVVIYKDNIIDRAALPSYLTNNAALTSSAQLNSVPTCTTPLSST